MAKKPQDDNRPNLGDPLDDPETSAVTTEPKRGRQGCQLAPVCTVHKVPMVSYASSAMKTYYRCPESGCPERDFLVRPVGPLKHRYGNGKSAQEHA